MKPSGDQTKTEEEKFLKSGVVKKPETVVSTDGKYEVRAKAERASKKR